MAMDNSHAEEIVFNRVNSDDSASSLERDNCHDRYEIVYATSAHGRYLVEGKEFSISPRTLMLIKPFTYHLVEITDNEYEICSIRFLKSGLPDRLVEMIDKICEDDRGRYYSPAYVSGNIISVIDRFEVAEALDENLSSELKQALLSELIILLFAADGEGMSASDNELGARVSEYLNRNIGKNLSLEKLAKRFFVSKYHLCRAFKSYSGISVHSYINHKRIMYAKQLIESGVTASDAAEKVGFGDYSAFYRAYVRIVGKSPTSL